MRDSTEFPQIPVKIAHIADPVRFPVDKIEGCFTLDLSGPYHRRNPFWNEGDDLKKKELPANELFEKMLAAGWKASMIGWTRDDGPTNFGQAPCVTHRLIAVMVKLKAT